MRNVIYDENNERLGWQGGSVGITAAPCRQRWCFEFRHRSALCMWSLHVLHLLAGFPHVVQALHLANWCHT